MPSTSSSSFAQPAAKHPPKEPDTVLAEAEAQWLFTEAELGQTPSIQDGMAPEVEREMRTKGLNFIMQVGIMLKLPQVTLSTAGIFFNRFLMRHSLVSKPDQNKALHHYQIAAISLFVASKTEENCRKLKELIVACCRVAQKNPSLIVDDSSKDFWRWRDTLLLNEDVLLEALCFDLSVESPHKLLFDLLKRLEAEHNKKLRNAAWAFINDSCLTMLCLLYGCRTVAAAAIYCAAKFCGDDTRFPDDDRGRPWWVWSSGGGGGGGGRGVKLIDIKRACNYMATIYGAKNNGVNGSGGGGGAIVGEPSIYVGLMTPIPSSASPEALAAEEEEEDAAEEGELEAAPPRRRVQKREEDEQDTTRNLLAKTRLRLGVVLQKPATPDSWLAAAAAAAEGATPKETADATATSSTAVTDDKRANSESTAGATRVISSAKRSLPPAGEREGASDAERAKKRVRTDDQKAALADDVGSEEGELEE